MTGPFDAVRESIPEKLARDNVPSLAIGVARHGEILWEEGFGWADRERRLLADAHTPYSLASVSKPMTATAIMRLVEAGQVELDNPVNDYLGAARLIARMGDARDATVRRVLDHTSGLPLHFHFFYEDEGVAPPPRELTILFYGNLVSSPGVRYQYSNLGYGVLDHVISRVTGMPYAEYMHNEIFLPLGMNRSAIGYPAGLEASCAVRYGRDGIPYPYYDFDHPGASAAFASVHDLLLFGLFHIEQPAPEHRRDILTPESRHAMRTLVDVEGIPKGGYAFGWNVRADMNGNLTVSHLGGMGGVATALHLLPDKGLVVATLCNASTELPWRIAEETIGAAIGNSASTRESREVVRCVREEETEVAEDSMEPPGDNLRPVYGQWQGQVIVPDGTQDLVLEVRNGEPVLVRLENSLETVLNESAFRAGRLSGRFSGRLRNPDVQRRAYDLVLDLALRGDALEGGLGALPPQGARDGGSPARRLGNGLTHWCSLRRRDA